MGKGIVTGASKSKPASISGYMTEVMGDARSWNSDRAGRPLSVTLIESDQLVPAAVAILREQSIIAVDFETTTHSGEYGEGYGPHAGDIRLVQAGYVDSASGLARQIIFDGQSVDLKPLRELLEDSQVAKVVHYCPFELEWARHHLDSDISALQDTCFAAQSVNKELRSRVAARCAPKADKAQLAELVSALSRPSDDGVRSTEAGLTVKDQAVEAATAKVVGDLITSLRKQDKQALAEKLIGWDTTERSRLMDLNLRYLGAEMSKEEQASDWSAPLSDEQLDYAAADAAVTLELAEDMNQLMNELGVGKRVAWRISKQRSELQPA